MICETSGAIFSSSFREGTIIDTERVDAGMVKASRLLLLSSQRPTLNIQLRKLSRASSRRPINSQSAIETADDGIRPRDLRFTNPLLYQPSSVGITKVSLLSREAFD